MDQSSWTVNSGGWVVLALVNAGLAEQKNRSRLTWFLVSLFIGPLATFLIVVWQRAPVDPIETLHPFTNRADRWLTLGTLSIVVALVLGVFVLITLNWATAIPAIVFLLLGVWALVLYRRVAREA